MIYIIVIDFLASRFSCHFLSVCFLESWPCLPTHDADLLSIVLSYNCAKNVTVRVLAFLVTQSHPSSFILRCFPAFFVYCNVVYRLQVLVKMTKNTPLYQCNRNLIDYSCLMATYLLGVANLAILQVFCATIFIHFLKNLLFCYIWKVYSPTNHIFKYLEHTKKGIGFLSNYT